MLEISYLKRQECPQLMKRATPTLGSGKHGQEAGFTYPYFLLHASCLLHLEREENRWMDLLINVF